MSQLIQVSIGGVDYSDRIQKFQVNRKATEGIGTFTLDLWNQDGALNSAFAVETSLTAQLATSYGGTLYPFFSGYIDKCDLITSQEQKSVGAMTLEIKGRDLGQDLQNLTVWGSDVGPIEQLVYNLLIYGVSDILGGANATAALSGNSPSNPYTNINYTIPSPLLSTGTGAANLLWSATARDYIGKSVTNLLQLANWDGYVDINGYWQMFPVGTVNSNIQLWDAPMGSTLPTSPTQGMYFILTTQQGTYPPGLYLYNSGAWNQESSSTNINNIIGPIHYQPVDGTELRNVIIAYGSTVQNSWTNYGQASSYWAMGNYSGAIVTITDAVDTNGQNGTTAYVTTPTGVNSPGGVDPYQEPIMGAGFLKITSSNNSPEGSIVWGLNFPLWFQDYLPLNYTSLQQISFSLFMHNSYQQPENEGGVVNEGIPVFIQLTDSIGNTIVYQFAGTYRFNAWQTFNVNVGYNISTEAQIYSGDGTWNGIDYPQPSGVNNVSIWNGADNTGKWVYTTYTNTGSSFPSPSSLNSTTGYFFVYTGTSQQTGLYFYNGSTWILKNKSVTSNNGFNWQVTQICWGLSNAMLVDYILFNNLVIPQVQIYAVANHSGLNLDGSTACQICGLTYPATTYRQRQLIETKPNIVYQTDLANYAETVALQRCGYVPNGVGGFTPNVLSTLSFRCDGRAGLVGGAWKWYPGLTVSFNGAVNYRMIEVKHTITRDVDGSGFDHVVDLSLVPKFFQLDMDQWTFNQHGDIGVSRNIDNRVQALQDSYQLFTNQPG